MTSSEYPTARQLARLRREFAILRDLDLPGVVRAHALEKCGRGVALVMEDLGPSSLHDLLAQGQRLDVRTALRIAISICDTLGALHRRGVIHKQSGAGARATWQCRDNEVGAGHPLLLALHECQEAGVTPEPQPEPEPEPQPDPGNGTYPSDVLNLANWHLTLPIDTPHAGSPDQIDQPELDTTLTSDYALGTPFTVKFEVASDKVKCYYNGALKYTYSKSFSGAYFKAGAYVQSSCQGDKKVTGELCSAYGEAVIYDLQVQHN